MPRYLLLAWDDPAHFADFTPSELAALVERYTRWTEELSRSGRLLASEKLADGGARRVTRQGGRSRVVDGPFTETKEVLGGFWLIEAADASEATQIAEHCPHAENGIVEVLGVEETD